MSGPRESACGLQPPACPGLKQTPGPKRQDAGPRAVPTHQQACPSEGSGRERGCFLKLCQCPPQLVGGPAPPTARCAFPAHGPASPARLAAPCGRNGGFCGLPPGKLSRGTLSAAPRCPRGRGHLSLQLGFLGGPRGSQAGDHVLQLLIALHQRADLVAQVQAAGRAGGLGVNLAR